MCLSPSDVTHVEVDLVEGSFHFGVYIIENFQSCIPE